MRMILIALQAGALTLFAVIGAQGESDAKYNCPLPSAQADAACHTPTDL